MEGIQGGTVTDSVPATETVAGTASYKVHIAVRGVVVKERGG